MERKNAKRRKIQEDKPSIPNILDSLDIDNSVKEALQYLKRTKISDDDDDVHAACVCVICDTFIIGVEPVHWISHDILLKLYSQCPWWKGSACHVYNWHWWFW